MLNFPCTFLTGAAYWTLEELQLMDALSGLSVQLQDTGSYLSVFYLLLAAGAAGGET